jgi:hypothetical protein
MKKIMLPAVAQALSSAAALGAPATRPRSFVAARGCSIKQIAMRVFGSG